MKVHRLLCSIVCILPTCRVDTLIARVNGKRCCCCCHGLENAQNTFSLLAGKDSAELKSELSNDHFVPQAFPFCLHPIGSLSRQYSTPNTHTDRHTSVNESFMTFSDCYLFLFYPFLSDFLFQIYHTSM